MKCKKTELARFFFRKYEKCVYLYFNNMLILNKLRYMLNMQSNYTHVTAIMHEIL